jgi:ribonuclease HII
LLKANLHKNSIEAGCDEAGRGCISGPVFAAAVILPPDFSNNELNDSKELSEKKRETLREIIIKESLDWAVASVDSLEIDKINILNASIKAMHFAISKLKITPHYLLIDGNRFKKYKSIPHECVIKGDSKFLSIAAASILAKTFRDDFMNSIHHEFPQYNWAQNKGYPTKEHRSAIQKTGISKYHRKSFKLLPDQFKIKFD